MCETERVGRDVWRMGIERGTGEDQQGGKDAEAEGEKERRKTQYAGCMWERCYQSLNINVWKKNEK